MNPSCSHTSVITYLIKAKKLGQQGRKKKKGSEKQQFKHQCKRSREGATDTGVETPLWPLEEPTLKQRSEGGLGRSHARAVFSLQGCSSWKSPHQSRGEVSDGRRDRENLLQTDCAHPYASLYLWGEWQDLREVKLSLEEGEKICCFVLLLIFVSHYQNPCSLAIHLIHFPRVRAVLLTK